MSEITQKATEYSNEATGLKATAAISQVTIDCTAPRPTSLKLAAANKGASPATSGSSSTRTARAMICMTDPARDTPARTSRSTGPAIDSFRVAASKICVWSLAPKLVIIHSESTSEARRAPGTAAGTASEKIR